jgi:hypothetical protein
MIGKNVKYPEQYRAVYDDTGKTGIPGTGYSFVDINLFKA